jgi:hypothetical protein
VCGWRLWLSAIEIMSSSTEQHSYICPLCDHTEQRTAPRWRAAVQKRRFLRFRLGYPAPTSEALLFLKPRALGREMPCTDWDVHEHKPSGRTVGRIYLNISTGGLCFWCLNDHYRSPPAHRGYAPTRVKECCRSSNDGRERGPLREKGKSARRSG